MYMISCITNKELIRTELSQICKFANFFFLKNKQHKTNNGLE